MFEAADRQDAVIYVPAFVLAEVGELVHRGTITLPMTFPRWVDALRRSGSYITLDLTADVVVAAQELFAIRERSDRLIAATAVTNGMALITRDPEIAACAGVERIWE